MLRLTVSVDSLDDSPGNSGVRSAGSGGPQPECAFSDDDGGPCGDAPPDSATAARQLPRMHGALDLSASTSSEGGGEGGGVDEPVISFVARPRSSGSNSLGNSRSRAQLRREAFAQPHSTTGDPSLVLPGPAGSLAPVQRTFGRGPRQVSEIIPDFLFLCGAKALQGAGLGEESAPPSVRFSVEGASSVDASAAPHDVAESGITAFLACAAEVDVVAIARKILGARADRECRAFAGFLSPEAQLVRPDGARSFERSGTAFDNDSEFSCSGNGRSSVSRPTITTVGTFASNHDAVSLAAASTGEPSPSAILGATTSGSPSGVAAGPRHYYLPPDAAAGAPACRLCHLPLLDTLDFDIHAMLEESFAFLELCRREGRKVVVFCREGRSRSAAVVVYFLMRTRCLGYADALDVVRAARPCADPNMRFCLELQEAQRGFAGKDHARDADCGGCDLPTILQ